MLALVRRVTMQNMENMENVRQAFTNQAMWCKKLGSPFTARLLAGLGDALDHTSATGTRILGWAGQPDAMGDSVPLRLAGALHALVRTGRLPELARLYPPKPLPLAKDLTATALAAIYTADEDICAWLDHTPQTNEVARSAILYPGMRYVAGKTGHPLSIFEVGASAGLNLFPDRFSYRFGSRNCGSPGSPVVLSPSWAGDFPDGREPDIRQRRGCDLNPLDVSDPHHQQRLLAFVWPDQEERSARLEAAIGLALDNPPQLDEADAADWVETFILPKAQPGLTRVLFHSIAFQYFPENSKQRIKTHMEKMGRTATPETPLAWLAFEQDPEHGACLTLRLWGTGSSNEGKPGVLATASNAHCNKIEWLG